MTEFSDFASIKLDEVFSKLDTTFNGLTQEMAKELPTKYGPNKIKSQEITAWDIFLRQFKSPFVYLLAFACVIAYLIGERIDSFMIFGFVVINSILGFYQEYRSEQTVKLLKKYLAQEATVLRDSKEQNIRVEDIVPGDILIFEPGDIIPADCRFIESYNLTVDESVLTGESAPVQKVDKEISGKVKDVYGAGNIGFSGTAIVSGRGKGVVFATGINTNYAKIVKLTTQTARESSFEKELTRFSKFTLIVVLVTLVLVIVASLAIKPTPSLVELTLFAIALAVSVIPEALPVVTTFSLSIGAANLAKKEVVVKRLAAVEDLGSVEILCSDKTGTLTENQLEVDEIFGEDKKKTLEMASLASYFADLSRNQQNNAFDIALQKKMGKDLKELKSYKSIVEIPFDPIRKRVTSLLETKTGLLLISRGATEEVIKICKVQKHHQKLMEWVNKKGSEGKRVLGVAVKKLEEKAEDLVDETGLEFIGAVSFIDPIKPSAYEAIDKAQKMGVAVKILTGDAKEVATDVAMKVRLIESEKEVITGDEFVKLKASEKHKAVEKYHVFARTTPEQKYEIIKLLEEKHSVGFLGEGINDAPALKIANVAIVVRGASDVARESSDIILLKRSLKVILDGIEEGRRVFGNTSKYITSTMTSNFGNFFSVAFVSLIIDFLPMLPLQILLVNLLSDFPMIFVATDNVDSDVMRVPRRFSIKDFAVTGIILGLVSTVFDFVYFGTFVGMGEKTLQTSWFMGSILTELLFIYSIRTHKFFLKGSVPSSALVGLTGVAALATLIVPFTRVGVNLFEFKIPTTRELSIVILIAAIYFAVTETVKFFYFNLGKRRGSSFAY
jgi:Mg2+-importing ATPase